MSKPKAKFYSVMTDLLGEGDEKKNKLGMFIPTALLQRNKQFYQKQRFIICCTSTAVICSASRVCIDIRASVCRWFSQPEWTGGGLRMCHHLNKECYGSPIEPAILLFQDITCSIFSCFIQTFLLLKNITTITTCDLVVNYYLWLIEKASST
jgi:hypothetical protein